ncbi:unnamed protein product [Closterium sp. NIES-64]|nr:unnamed protein product [Closterium sp. NIES-65]CAI5986606.1 unnamed protein product [Closterium sp. NIES-64]
MDIGLAGNVHLGGGSVCHSEGAYIADGVSYSSNQHHSGASPWQGHHPPAYGGSVPVAPPPLLPPPPPPPLRLELPWQAQAQPAPYPAQQTQGQPAGSHGQYNAVQHMQVTQPLAYQQPQMQQPQQRQPAQEPSPAPVQQHYYPQEYSQQQSYQYVEHRQQSLYPQQLGSAAAHAEYTSAPPIIPADPTTRPSPELLHIPAFASAPPSTRPADAPCPCCHRRNPPAPVSTAPLVYNSLPPPEVPPRNSAPMLWGGNGAPPASPVISAAPTGGTAESAYAGESGAGVGAGSCGHPHYPCGSRWTGGRGPAGGALAGCTGGGHACSHGCAQGYICATYETQQHPMYEEGARGRVSSQVHPQSSALPRVVQTAAWFPSPAAAQAQRHRSVPRVLLSPSCWTYGDQRAGPAAAEHPAEAAMQQPRIGPDRRGYNQRDAVVVASSSGSGADSDSCSGDGDGNGRCAGVVWPVTSDEMKATVAEMSVAVLGGQMNGQVNGQMAESEDMRKPARKIEELKGGELARKRKREEVCGEAGITSEKSYQRANAVACEAGGVAAPPSAKTELADCDMEAVELILAVAHQLRDGKESQATQHATESGREEEGVRKLDEDRGAEGEEIEGKGEAGSGGGAAGATAEASRVSEVPAAAAPAAEDDKQRVPACSSGPFPPLHPVGATVHMAPAGPHGSHTHTPVSLSSSSDRDCTGCGHSKPGAWGFAMGPSGGCGAGGCGRVAVAPPPSAPAPVPSPVVGMLGIPPRSSPRGTAAPIPLLAMPTALDLSAPSALPAHAAPVTAASPQAPQPVSAFQSRPSPLCLQLLPCRQPSPSLPCAPLQAASPQQPALRLSLPQRLNTQSPPAPSLPLQRPSPASSLPSARASLLSLPPTLSLPSPALTIQPRAAYVAAAASPGPVSTGSSPALGARAHSTLLRLPGHLAASPQPQRVCSPC